MLRWKIDPRPFRALCWLVTVLTVVWVTGTSAMAQAPDGFQPATNIGRENLPALPLLYAAYGFVWVSLLVYVFVLWRRLDRVEKELHEVTSRIKAAGAKR